MLVVLASLIVVSSLETSTSKPEPDMSTQARQYAPKVKVTLDVTTPQQLMEQLPMRAETSRGQGEDRIFK